MLLQKIKKVIFAYLFYPRMPDSAFSCDFELNTGVLILDLQSKYERF